MEQARNPQLRDVSQPTEPITKIAVGSFDLSIFDLIDLAAAAKHYTDLMRSKPQSAACDLDELVVIAGRLEAHLLSLKEPLRAAIAELEAAS